MTRPDTTTPSVELRSAGLSSADSPITVSIVIPTYNRSRTIREAIESALNQSYDPIQVVVVDDGSTDDTADILASYGNRIRSIHQENQGVAAARNTGIDAADGSIIMFVDSDDLITPSAASAHVELLARAGPSVPCSLGDLEMKDATGVSVSMFRDRKVTPASPTGIWTNVQDVLSSRFLFTNQTLAVRKEAFVDVGMFDDSLWVMEDFAMAMRLAALGPWAYTTTIVSIRRVGLDSNLTAQAESRPRDLATTIVRICDSLINDNVANTPRSRRALAFMRRKARRQLRLTQRPPQPVRAILQGSAFVEEKLLERVYRNSPFFPHMSTESFPSA